ncbi:RNA polymerase factor sigma-54 [Cesiribacter andamanensis]|uniref:RNA polymerase factor sigma-54 n=1 Tax=Cesiribacter andamanensis AMV16 TaxID=1279009 RepID=M7N0H0_9BACT|nr:RNA polymerase factor sigma-54 [Cesiribacter andamanensis]EMR00777.1 RNA polymerase factor sigma-54 [Cesiribacter andamanensis AMV16]
MQNLKLSQTLSQKLSPQQIQFIKLLQVPTAELDARIEEELESNPALEEGPDEAPDESPSAEEEFEEGERYEDELDVSDYLRDDDYAGYKMQGDGPGDEEERDMPLAAGSTLTEQLLSQLGFLGLDERQEAIGRQLIGSIEPDGYIRRELDAIANDLAFSQNLRTDEEELEQILQQIQEFDPPGIAARDLRECLLLQLRRKEPTEAVQLATRLIEDHFEEFTKKHYKKILRRLGLEEEEDLKSAIEVITRLNPKPGGAAAGSTNRTQYLLPDFIITNDSGKLELTLNGRNAPDLRISRSYADMLDAYDRGNKKDKKLKETVSFVKQKLDAARWFIDAIRQRQHTLLNVMGAIMDYQYEYFLEGDETKLRPMILKDIADQVGMDISTISRVANSKSVQTEFGILPLKYFFSEGISTDTGEDVSSREVKQVLKEMIDGENKRKPLSDDKLEKMLNDKGYQIARRTVAKYREQLGIPVARLRKEL